MSGMCSVVPDKDCIPRFAIAAIFSLCDQEAETENPALTKLFALFGLPTMKSTMMLKASGSPGV